MTAVALFDLLQDFGKRAAPAAASIATAQPRPDARHENFPQQPGHREIVEAEVAKAQAVMEQSLGVAHAAELELMRREHADEIALMLRRFGEDAGATIAARLDELEARVGEHACAASARILGSVLSDDLTGRSVESLARAVREAAADRESVRIRVHGPQSMFEALRDRLGERAAHLDFTETAGFDLTVSVDGALFETRLSEWSSDLSEALS